MKQKQYAPISNAQMALSMYAAERGYLADVEVSKVGAFEEALLAWFKREKADLMATLNKEAALKPIDAQLKEGVEQFKATQSW